MLIPSDEYWKLYDQFTATLKRLAEAQDSLDVTKRSLSDTMAEREFDLLKPREPR